MILGRDFINNQEERLYSTGDEMLDNLLEKAFCEGYELAQREFAEKEDKEEKKLRWSDKINIKRLKKLYDKDEELKNIHLKQVDEDPEVRKEGDKQFLRKTTESAVKMGTAGSAIMGGLYYGLSRLSGDDRKESAKNAHVVLGAGALGTLAGTGGGRLLSKLSSGVREKGLKKGKESTLKNRDAVRVAAGKMSEEEFTKKWGKNKKK